MESSDAVFIANISEEREPEDDVKRSSYDNRKYDNFILEAIRYQKKFDYKE